jgi:hypothetical protein
MMLLAVFKPRAGSKGPALHLNLLPLAFGGFFYGLMVVFGFRLLRWPLVTITAPALAALCWLESSTAKELNACRATIHPFPLELHNPDCSQPTRRAGKDFILTRLGRGGGRAAIYGRDRIGATSLPHAVGSRAA